MRRDKTRTRDSLHLTYLIHPRSTFGFTDLLKELCWLCVTFGGSPHYSSHLASQTRSRGSGGDRRRPVRTGDKTRPSGDPRHGRSLPLSVPLPSRRRPPRGAPPGLRREWNERSRAGREREATISVSSLVTRQGTSLSHGLSPLDPSHSSCHLRFLPE